MKPWIACVYTGLLFGWTLTWAQSPASGGVLAPYQWENQKRDVVRDRLVLYYFGASDCAPCNAPENIELVDDDVGAN